MASHKCQPKYEINKWKLNSRSESLLKYFRGYMGQLRFPDSLATLSPGADYGERIGWGKCVGIFGGVSAPNCCGSARYASVYVGRSK